MLAAKKLNALNQNSQKVSYASKNNIHGSQHHSFIGSPRAASARLHILEIASTTPAFDCRHNCNDVETGG
jgi:hypothetical protein